MSQFIETRDGLINVHAIVRIRESWTNGPPQGMRTEIEYRDATGRPRTTTGADPGFDPLHLAAPIAAQIGYHVVNLSEDPEAVVYRLPVIAWRVPSGAFSAAPICPDEPARAWAILCPDGRVIAPQEATFETVDAWRESVLEDRAKHRAVQAAIARGSA